jgi:VIT1/CCC1 family predicted Fe2+/Mn2+ transporter
MDPRIEELPHEERHFMASEVVADIVLGMADGLTVPFAIAAGLSGARVASTIVVIGGLSEIAAGAISMGVGGFLSARQEIEHYHAEREREIRETQEVPDQEKEEVSIILQEFGLEEQQAEPIVENLSKDRERWVDFMMRFELGLEKPERLRALQSGITIGLAYAIAGFIPLSPYFGIRNVSTALYVSAGVTMLAMFVFGFVKARVTGVNAWVSALQTLALGALAAGAAFGISRLVRGGA